MVVWGIRLFLARRRVLIHRHRGNNLGRGIPASCRGCRRVPAVQLCGQFEFGLEPVAIMAEPPCITV